MHTNISLFILIGRHLISKTDPSFAAADLDLFGTLFTFDKATPVELAFTPLSPLFPPRCVAPAAAEQVAPVDALGVLKEGKKLEKKGENKILRCPSL